MEKGLIEARLADMYGCNPRTIRRWRKDGKLPPPDGRTPGGRVIWFTSTIEADLRKRLQEA